MFGMAWSQQNIFTDATLSAAAHPAEPYEQHGGGVVPDVWSLAQAAHRASPAQMPCQVEGCTADLSLEEKAYCQKKRICGYHMRAEAIRRSGDDQQLYRFCFQCGKLEPLTCFEGSKRSCRARLERRKLPPKRSMTWTAGCGRSNSSSSTQSTPFAEQDAMQHQLLLEKQQQQMLLLQQHHHQQQQAQQAAMMLNPAGYNAAAAAGPDAVKAETLMLLQQQALLIEQKRMQLQALRAAMAQDGLGMQLAPGLSPNSSGTTTPSVVTPSVLGAPNRVSFAGLSGITPTSAQDSPAGSVGQQQKWGLSGAASGSASAGTSAFGSAQQQMLATQSPGATQTTQDAQAGSSTGAEAAAAFADSCNWWASSDAGAAERPTSATSAPIPQAPHSSGMAPMRGAQSEGAAIMMTDDGLELDDMLDDAFDPLSSDLAAAAFPELNVDMPAHQPQSMQLKQEQEAAQHRRAEHHAQLQQVLQQEQQLQQQLSALMMGTAGMGAQQQYTAAPGGAMHGSMVSSIMRAGTPPRGFVMQLGGAATTANSSAGMPPVACMPQQAGALDQQLQIQQLMASVSSLHESVRQLTLQVQGGGGTASAASTATAATMMNGF